MTSSNTDDARAAETLELKGLRILLVEDSWHLGIAMKNLLRAWGADVAGPIATVADAERMISEYAPDATVVDFNLRGGERALGLIDRLHDKGVRVVVTSGYTNLPLAPGKATAVLQKPINETQLLASLRSIAAHKAAGE